MKKIKVGVIGTGFIGPVHVEAIRRQPNTEVIALSEINEELARDKADSLGIERAYGDYKELIADPDVEVKMCIRDRMNCWENVNLIF